MIEAKATSRVGGEYGYRICVEDEGLYIKDGTAMVFIDEGDYYEVMEAMVKTWDEFREFKKWREEMLQKTETNI